MLFADTGLISVAITIFSIVFFMLGGIYVAGPLLIKFTFWARAKPVVQVYDPYTFPPPQDVSDYFNYVHAELQKVGFVATSHQMIPDMVPNVDSFVMFMQNPRSQIEGAGLVVMVKNGAPGVGKMQSHAVEFSTEFLGGGSLDTSNVQEEYVLHRPPEHPIAHFQYVLDPCKLYQIHCKLLEEAGNPQRKPLTPAGGEPQAIAASTEREFAAQIPAGILQLNAARDKYVPTLFGAYKMTWGNLFPLKQINRARRKRKCDAMLQRWGML